MERYKKGILSRLIVSDERLIGLKFVLVTIDYSFCVWVENHPDISKLIVRFVLKITVYWGIESEGLLGLEL